MKRTKQLTLLDLGENVGIDSTVDLDWAEYRSLAEQVFAVQHAVRWWVGDLLILGLRLFGDNAWQMVPSVYERDTIEKSVRVCEAFPRDRRRGALRFSHHQACLPLDEADADRLLEQAVFEEWSVVKIREAVKEITGNDSDDGGPTIVLTFLGWDPDLVVVKAETDLRLSELREYAEKLVAACEARTPLVDNA